MKLFKKLALISAVLVFAALPASAELYTDNFEQHTAEKSTFNYYPTDTGKTSDVFTDAGKWCSAFSLVKRTGVSGQESMMLRLSAANSDSANLPIRSIKHKEGQIVRFTYDIYFDSLPANSANATSIGYTDSNYNLRLGIGDSSVMKTGWEGKQYTLSEDVWYKVIATVTGNGTQTISLTNPLTEEVYLLSDAKTYSEDATIGLVAVSLSWAAPSAVILIDNAELMVYNPADSNPVLIESTVLENEDNVQRNKVFTFKFDQEIAANPTVEFKTKDGADVPGVQVEKVGYNTITVSYTGLLERNEDYVLSFTGVSNGMNESTDEIYFATEDLHIWNDIPIASAVTNEDDATKTDVTFTIGEKYGYSVFSGSVMAVVYQDGKMIEADIKPLNNVAVGELKQSFALGTVPADAKIGIILLDVEKGPIPLAGGMLEN